MTRQQCAAMVLGGPTTVLDLGGLRVVSDPTFDAPGPHGYLTKTAGPVVADDELGRVDLVLISHDNHPDNLDDRGRALALAAPLVLTTGSGAKRLGQHRSGGLGEVAMGAGRVEGGIAHDSQATEVQNGRRTAHHHDRAFLSRHHRYTLRPLLLLPTLGGEPFDGLELLVDFRFGRPAVA